MNMEEMRRRKAELGYTNEQIAFFGGMKIIVNAHAIQAAGFGTADLAWAAFDAQTSANS